MVKALNEECPFVPMNWMPNGEMPTGGCSNWNGDTNFGSWSDCIARDQQTSQIAMTSQIDEEKLSYCAGCGEKICDRYYLYTVGRQWHVNCLRCSDCKSPLDSELTCFARDGNIYCKEDYYRRFAERKCARCQQGLSADEMVMRAREHVFHISCFICHSCNKTLTTGEEFGMKDNLIYCRRDYELLYQGEFFYNFNEQIPNNQPTFFNGMTGVRRGRPRKRKGTPPEEHDDCSLASGGGLSQLDSLSPYMDMSSDGHGSLSSRQKRVRTSFKHHQLRMMKSYFALNQNPDAKDLKQLSQKTGLPKRVLQVWFQNARAKYRRNLLKQQDSGSRDQGDVIDKSQDDELDGGATNVSLSSCSPVDLSMSNSNSSLNESFET